MPLTFLVGGARSGKSSLAVDLVTRHATAAGAAKYLIPKFLL